MANSQKDYLPFDDGIASKTCNPLQGGNRQPQESVGAPAWICRAINPGFLAALSGSGGETFVKKVIRTGAMYGCCLANSHMYSHGAHNYMDQALAPVKRNDETRSSTLLTKKDGAALRSLSRRLPN